MGNIGSYATNASHWGLLAHIWVSELGHHCNSWVAPCNMTWTSIDSWWRHQMETFPRYWPFARGIHRSPVNSPHKGQWRGALMFSLICVWINGWVNNRQAGDLRRYRAHYDVIVMLFSVGPLQRNSFNKMYLNIKSAKMWLFRSIPHVFQATISVTDSTHTSMGSHADTGCENEQILCMRMVLCITACINLPF